VTAGDLRRAAASLSTLLRYVSRIDRSDIDGTCIPRTITPRCPPAGEGRRSMISC